MSIKYFIRRESNQELNYLILCQPILLRLLFYICGPLLNFWTPVGKQYKVGTLNSQTLSDLVHNETLILIF